MRTWMPSTQAAAAFLAPVLCATVLGAGQTDQAQEVLTQVRKALGGDAKLAAVKTLSAEGTYRRVMGESEMNGDLELFFVLPDKFQRIEQMTLPTGMPGPRIATTLNGAEAWMGPLGPVPGGMMIRIGDGPGGPGGPGGAGGPGGPGGQGQRFDPLPRVRGDFWRTALAFLPGTPATSGLTFTYVGKAESPDGQAEVLEAKGEGNFTARVFVNAESHLPVMLTYMDRDPTRMMTQRFERREGETPEARRARIEEERKKREAEGPPPPPPMVEMSWFFADHKKVDGVLLPHRITQQTGDKPVAGVGDQEVQAQRERRSRAVQAQDVQLVFALRSALLCGAALDGPAGSAGAAVSDGRTFRKTTRAAGTTMRNALRTLVALGALVGFADMARAEDEQVQRDPARSATAGHGARPDGRRDPRRDGHHRAAARRADDGNRQRTRRGHLR